MQVHPQISFRNVTPSDAILTKVRERIGWLESYCDQMISCHVVIEKPHRRHRKGNLFHVRVRIRLPGSEVVVSRDPAAHGAYKDLYVTIHHVFDEARRKLEDSVRLRRREVKISESAPHAFVVRLVRDDGGYGFIRTLENRELYFHSHSVLNGKFDQLQIGSEVRFNEEMGENGPQASTIVLAGKEGKSPSAA
jgi:cold shock CspA family protein/ribosome-associated translation inhibitor RaiA